MVEEEAFCEHCGAELEPLNFSDANITGAAPETGDQSPHTGESGRISTPADNGSASCIPTASAPAVSPKNHLEKAPYEAAQDPQGAEYAKLPDVPAADGGPCPACYSDQKMPGPSAIDGVKSENRIRAESECPDVLVELDESVILVEGMRSFIRLRVTNMGKRMDAVKLLVLARDPLTDQFNSSSYRFPGLSRIRRNASREALVVFEVPSFGLQPARCKLSFKREGERFSYETNDTAHTVYQQSDQPQQVINQVINNIENKGHAADVPVNNTVDFYRNLNNRASVNQILDEAAKAPNAWIPLALYEADTEQEPDVKHILPKRHAPVSAKVDRLSLKTSSFLIHLLAGEKITLGRKRVTRAGKPANDIVTRIFRDGQWADTANQTKISSYHCHIRKRDDRCEIVDAGLYPDERKHKNVWGTYVDGEQIPPGESVGVQLNDEFTLSLARSNPSAPDSFAFRCRTLTCDLWNDQRCPAPGRCGKDTPSAMVLHRYDELHEIFVILWGHVRLTVADPGLGKLCALRTADAFAIYLDDFREWLEPGKNIDLPTGDQVSVLEYSQAKLKPTR